MFPAPKAVVIIPIERGITLDLSSIERVIETSGPILDQLILLHTDALSSSFNDWLVRQSAIDRRIRAIRGSHQTGVVGSCNRGLLERRGDAVILAQDCEVGPDWLCELGEVAHSEERTGCVSPLTIVAGT